MCVFKMRSCHTNAEIKAKKERAAQLGTSVL